MTEARLRLLSVGDPKVLTRATVRIAPALARRADARRLPISREEAISQEEVTSLRCHPSTRMPLPVGLTAALAATLIAPGRT